MNLYEAEGKQAMKIYGIPVAEEILFSKVKKKENVKFPCVVKAQVLSGKRGKAGGILFAENADELEDAARRIFQMEIGGGRPADLLIAPKLDIQQEHYLGIILDRGMKEVLMLYSPYGGIEIETMAESEPEKLVRIILDQPFTYELWLENTERFGMDEEEKQAIYEIACRLLNMFYATDATTLEINPLVRTAQGEFVAADAKLVIDDNSMYRQNRLLFLPRDQKEDKYEVYAHEHNLAFVELEKNGTIGVIAGGAGIGMATVDAVKYYGESPFNFLDLGGGVTEEKTYQALSMLMKIDNIKGIVVNIFGGANNCLTMAKGITRAYGGQEKGDVQLVVKSRGFNQEDGWALYDGLGIPQVRYGTTDDAVKKLIGLLKRGEGEK